MNRAAEQSSYVRAAEPVDSLDQIRIRVRCRWLLQSFREEESAVGLSHSSVTGEGEDESGKKFFDPQADHEWLEGSDGEPAGRDTLRGKAKQGTYYERVLNSHQGIVEAIEAGDPEGARAAFNYAFDGWYRRALEQQTDLLVAAAGA